MKKLSLRMRLTLTVVALITAVAVVLALFSLFNAGYWFTRAIDDVHTDEDMMVSVAGSTDADQKEQGALDAAIWEDGFYIAEWQEDQPEVVSVTLATQSFNYISLIYTVIVIAAGGVITWFVIGYALRPVKKLSAEIAGISENQLDVRITEFQAGDEISRLADSFNLMLSRLEKAFENQKSFSTAAAHELKTPLTTIKARLDVMDMEGKPAKEEYKKTTEITRKQTERMIGIVEDLFLFSMTQEHEYNDTVVLEELAEEVAEHIQMQAREKKLTINIAKGAHAVTAANRSMLERALTNVMENAVKYNRDDGKVFVEVTEEEKAYVIAVADTGPGIAQGEAAKIFEPFYRIDSSRSRKTAGAGLGLAIAKNMVEKHGGKISVGQSDTGGSVFYIRLPRRV